MHNPEPAGDGLLYEKRKSVFPKAVTGQFRRFKWLVMLGHAGDLLHHALDALGSRALCARSGGADRSGQPPLLHVRHRDLAARILFRRGPADHGRDRAVSGDQRGGPGLVRLCLPADGVDRPVPACRPAGRWRPQCADEAAGRALGAGQDRAARCSNGTIYLSSPSVTGGAWIIYFADAPTLHREFWTRRRRPPIAYATVGVLTATTFVFGGFMREQVCIYMCPWPRIQTAMLDEKIADRHLQGLARRTARQRQASARSRRCRSAIASIATSASRSARPAIDIRNGPDIACITCALCIDACDGVMQQLGRPRGLIDYATLEDSKRENARAPSRRRTGS